MNENDDTQDDVDDVDELDDLPKEPVVIYVNTSCDNEATAGETIDDLAASLGDVTWRELLEECLRENVADHEHDLAEWLEDYYGLEPGDLDKKIDAKAVDRYYPQLCFRQDNMTGSNVEVFELIWSLDLFPTDDDGNGVSNGIRLEQSTANGPRKSVYIDSPESAQWLIAKAAEQGVTLEVRFV
jgi:hypothetical protein